MTVASSTAGAPAAALSGGHEHATQLGRLFASPGPVTVEAVRPRCSATGRGGVPVRLAAVSAAGLALFLWPLTGLGAPGAAAAAAVSIGCVVVLVAVETMSRRLDTRGLAVIAAVAAVDSALRLALVSGIGGFSPIFLLILCAGYAMGAEFGFVCGAAALLVSALVTAGVGPWLPYEMIAAGWVGAAGGLAGTGRRGRTPQRRDVMVLAAVGVVSGFAYGAVMDLWDWTFFRGAADFGYVAGLPLGDGGGSLRALLPGDVARLRLLPCRRQRGAGGDPRRARARRTGTPAPSPHRGHRGRRAAAA